MNNEFCRENNSHVELLKIKKATGTATDAELVELRSAVRLVSGDGLPVAFPGFIYPTTPAGAAEWASHFNHGNVPDPIVEDTRDAQQADRPRATNDDLPDDVIDNSFALASIKKGTTP
jgi:hypothetical protein